MNTEIIKNGIAENPLTHTFINSSLYGAHNISMILENSSFPKSNIDLLKNLWENGMLSSELFNIPDSNSNTLLHKLIRVGSIDLAKEIIKCIRKNELVYGNFPAEELEDCLATFPSDDFILSGVDREDAMVAQNGCRAIVMDREGGILSIPGQEARKLYKKILKKDPKENSFQIYLNPGHASIRMPNGQYYGFYPDSIFEKKADLGNIVPCEIRDDFDARDESEKTNQLMLEVFATEKQVKAIQNYIDKSSIACAKNKMSYQMLVKNCINFVQNAMKAAGTKADFLRAFQIRQYVRRLGWATSYALFCSTTAENSSQFLSYFLQIFLSFRIDFLIIRRLF